MLYRLRTFLNPLPHDKILDFSKLKAFVEDKKKCDLTLSQTTNFRLFQTEGVCRRQFQTWWKGQKVLRTSRKHCGKMSNFSFSHSVFKGPVLKTRKNQGLFGKGLKRENSFWDGKKTWWEKEKMLVTSIFSFSLNPFPHKPWFLRACCTSPLKTLWEKEKSLVTSNFSFSHRVFYSFWELSAIFIKFDIVVCKLFQFGRV